MTSPYPHYQQAAERIDADSDLLPFRNSFIKYDWSEGDEHYRWVATAPKTELLDWAETVAADDPTFQDCRHTQETRP